MNNQLKPCPFCGGNAILETQCNRSGYGEYESTEKYHVVCCEKCKAQGKRIHQQHLINFTKYTVRDFRENPILRAKVEDDYDSYCDQTKQLAIDSWEQRA